MLSPGFDSCNAATFGRIGPRLNTCGRAGWGMRGRVRGWSVRDVRCGWLLFRVAVGGSRQPIHDRQPDARLAERSGVDRIAAGRVKLAERREQPPRHPFEIALAS